MSKELSITGRLIKVLPRQTGDGAKGKWFKQEFAIETLDQYPKKVCFSAWGDHCDLIADLKKDEEVTVSFNVESHEYNERWYTELKIWKVVRAQKKEKTGLGLDEAVGEDLDDDNSLPF